MRILLSIAMFVSFLFSVDINTANVEELATLKGIGAKKAQAIVEYRTTNKCFKSLEELKDVKGIGNSIFAKNEKELSLSPCK